MPRVVWTRRAQRDLVRLESFLRPKSHEAARRASRAIREGLRTLEQFPQSGRPVEGAPIDLRDWIIDFGSSGYIVRHEPTRTGILVVAVRHAREAGFWKRSP